MPRLKDPEWWELVKAWKERGLFEPPELARGPLAFGYVRVSHADSAGRGISLPAQIDIIEVYYARLVANNPELDYGCIYQDEVVSAYRKTLIEREGGAKLCLALRPGDHVIFAYLDRGFRQLLDTMTTIENWQDRRITSHFCNFQIDTSTPEGWFLLTQHAAMAEYYSRSMSARIKASLEHVKLKFHGKVPLGREPYGMKKVGRGKNRQTLVVDEKQIEWGSWIVELWREEGLTLRTIAKMCQERVVKLMVAGDTEFLKWRDKCGWSADRVRRWCLYEERRREVKRQAEDKDQGPR